MRRSPIAFALLLAAGLCAPSCRRPELPDEKAVELVRAYNDRVIAAYRHADARLVEGFAGPDEAKKILGLVGVKADQGLFMEATILEFRSHGVKQADGKVVVETREKWYYRDRRMKTGAQEGQDSTDTYHLRYTLGKPEGKWVVEQVDFASPPQVGRTEVLTTGDAETMHGISLRDDAQAPPRAPGTAAPTSHGAEKR